MSEPGAQECANDASHTPCPEGYIAWHSWAERKQKTHRQVKCPGCGLFVIWVPRKDKP